MGNRVYLILKQFIVLPRSQHLILVRQLLLLEVTAQLFVLGSDLLNLLIQSIHFASLPVELINQLTIGCLQFVLLLSKRFGPGKLLIILIKNGTNVILDLVKLVLQNGVLTL